MKKIYKALSLTIDITSINSIEGNILKEDLDYFIKINGEKCRVFSIREHEKYIEYLTVDNKHFSLCMQRRSTESDIELRKIYAKMVFEIKKPIDEMVKLEVEKLINYWAIYNDGVGI